MSADPPVAIDLAPSNPYSLILPSPVLPAPGCELRETDAALLAAIVTRTATLHTRRGPPPRFAPAPAGLVVSEVPTLSLRSLLKEESRRWERSTLPVIVSLQGDVDELAEMVNILENVEAVSAILITAEGDVAAAVRAARTVTPRPMLALIEGDAHLLAIARNVVAAGADALVVAAPPRAASAADTVVDGYLLGPAAFPHTLRALLDLKDTISIPRVALGGVVTPAFARAALDAGASAVMVDAPRWGDINAAARIAHDLAGKDGSQ